MSRRFRWWLGIAGAVGDRCVARRGRDRTGRELQGVPVFAVAGRLRESRALIPMSAESESGGGDFSITNSCNSAIGVHNTGRASQGNEGRWTWYAPPGTAITHAPSGLEDLRSSRRSSAPISAAPGGTCGIADGNEYWQGYGWNFERAVGVGAFECGRVRGGRVRQQRLNHASGPTCAT